MIDDVMLALTSAEYEDYEDLYYATNGKLETIIDKVLTGEANVDILRQIYTVHDEIFAGVRRLLAEYHNVSVLSGLDP